MEANTRDGWRRKRFKENLDRLLTERGLTRKAASDAAKVDYDWLRRAVSRGIAWPDKRSLEWLKKLGDTLGLDDVERLWGRHFVVPPEPSSIKDEAERFGEEMRQYVLLVGAEDATLKGIVEQMRRAVWAARIAEKKGTATSSSPPKLGSPAVLDSPSEPTGSPSSPIRSAEILPPVNTPSTPPQPLAERLEQAKRAIAEARAAREAARGEPTSSGHSTSDRVSNLPPQEPPLGVGGLSGDPTQDDSNNEVDRRPAGSPIGLPRSKWADGLIAELARRVLGDFDQQCLGEFREIGLPRVEEVTLTGAEFLSHAQSEGSGLTGDDAFRLAYLPWLEKYGSLLGTTWQTADAYVQAWRYFWERRRPSVGGASPGDRPSDGMAELKGLPPNALIARHGEEWGKECDEEVRRIRAEARPLVARVLDALSPGQHDHFFGGFASRERGELYLLDELVRRIRDAGIGRCRRMTWTRRSVDSSPRSSKTSRSHGTRRTRKTWIPCSLIPKSWSLLAGRSITAGATTGRRTMTKAIGVRAGLPWRRRSPGPSPRIGRRWSGGSTTSGRCWATPRCPAAWARTGIAATGSATG